MRSTTIMKKYNYTSIQRNIFKSNSVKLKRSPILPEYLLQAALESLADGILILTTGGEIIHGNEFANRLCQQLIPASEPGIELPHEVWRVCQSLIDSREMFPGTKICIESELLVTPSVKLKIRARWLELNDGNDDLLLVSLEDSYQCSQNIAIADVQMYGLTNREAEVWLLRRASLSYQEIANKLYISINTVKKHLKNIYAKQQEMAYS